MLRIRLASAVDECYDLWKNVLPDETIWDLWEVRRCFDEHFNRTRLFVVAEENDSVVGLLPLSWIDESNVYGYFPGETWQGMTWLEQNRIHAENESIARILFDSVPSNYNLRYLRPEGVMLDHGETVDEIGYLFEPPRYDFDMEVYYREFSHKSVKRITREIRELEARGVQYRYDDLGDFDTLVSLNLDRFEERSYFHDIRFRESLRDLMYLLHRNGWLRITTVMIGGEAAAVDLGCVYNGTYTLLAGGTSGEHPGIAKLINIHHMKWACEYRLSEVDFLCGAFAWKPMFHLTERPLFLLDSSAAKVAQPSQQQEISYAG